LDSSASVQPFASMFNFRKKSKIFLEKMLDINLILN
jgi:hypothetical protein